jgi:Rhodanese-related sulfurtransferase
MNIVNVDWLEKNLNNDCVIILDCSWHLPNTNRSGEKDFLSERIPGAIFFNIDDISDPKSPYPT